MKKRRRKKGKMPAALRAYWAKRRGAGKGKRRQHAKRKRRARPRVQQQPIYIVV